MLDMTNPLFLAANIWSECMGGICFSDSDVCSCALTDSRCFCFASHAAADRKTAAVTLQGCKMQVRCMHRDNTNLILLLTNSRGPFSDEGPQGPRPQLCAFLNQPICAAALQGSAGYCNFPLAALPRHLHCKTAMPVRESSCIRMACQKYDTNWCPRLCPF